MSDVNAGPAAEYRLERLWCPRQSCEVVDAEEVTDNEPDTMQIGWDWRFTTPQPKEGGTRFEVLLQVSLVGFPGRPERVKVDMLARFEKLSEESAPDLKRFVMRSGPSILLPYMRERVANMTSQGAFDTIQIPILNVVNLIAEANYERSTGARQLSEGAPETNEDEAGQEA